MVDGGRRCFASSAVLSIPIPSRYVCPHGVDCPHPHLCPNPLPSMLNPVFCPPPSTSCPVPYSLLPLSPLFLFCSVPARHPVRRITLFCQTWEPGRSDVTLPLINHSLQVPSWLKVCLAEKLMHGKGTVHRV